MKSLVLNPKPKQLSEDKGDAMVFVQEGKHQKAYICLAPFSAIALAYLVTLPRERQYIYPCVPLLPNTKAYLFYPMLGISLYIYI